LLLLLLLLILCSDAGNGPLVTVSEKMLILLASVSQKDACFVIC